MASLDNNILQVIEPSIRPASIEIKNVSEEDKGGNKQTKSVGVATPFVSINNYDFTHEDIDFFKLNVTGEYPKLSLTVRDKSKVFDVGQYPRDGDNITILINTKNQEVYKSVHMDFDITSVSSPSEGSQDSVRYYSFQGICKVPGLFSENCKSYSEGTSLDHLEEIATELKLGLATNIDSTNDSQKRIQPYTTTFNFIKDIVNTSYVGEECFQTCYIDQYYNLNFVDLNKIFNSKRAKGEDAESMITSYTQSIEVDSTAEGGDNIDGKLYLTNNTQAEGGSNKIASYNLKNNSSKISLSNGYKRTLQMWDDLEESSSEYEEDRLVEFDIEAFSTKKENLLDVEEPLKGRRDETSYESHLKHKWIGRIQDYSLEGNVHLNHKYSILNNFQNMQELEKMKLVVELQNFNPAIYRNQMIPVLMYNYSKEKVEGSRNTDEILKKKGAKPEDKSFDFKDDGESQMTLDSFLSGHYIVGGLEYIYETGNRTISQRLTLLRREWPVRANSI